MSSIPCFTEVKETTKARIL